MVNGESLIVIKMVTFDEPQFSRFVKPINRRNLCVGGADKLRALTKFTTKLVAYSRFQSLLIIFKSFSYLWPGVKVNHTDVECEGGLLVLVC